MDLRKGGAGCLYDMQCVNGIKVLGWLVSCIGGVEIAYFDLDQMISSRVGER